MKKHRKLLLILAVVMSVAIAAGSTMAYLQDTDEDVNVMTLGNVYINQLEYERVEANGLMRSADVWVSTGETDKYGYIPDEVQLFTQGKPLYPAVFEDGEIKWDDRNGSQAASGEGSYQQSWGGVKGEKVSGAPGSNQLFDDSVKNAIDKFVFVENTGSADAYVRTWIALEQGEIPAEDFKKVIMTNSDQEHWAWKTVATDVAIEDTEGNTGTYYVLLATYLGPKSNPTGILAPGSISYPSLLQVYMKPEAGNEEVEKIDGNKNGKYDILVYSQAVQTAGFADAETALNEAFGEPAEENIPWDKVRMPIFVSTADELRAAMKKEDVEIILADDILVDDDKGTGYCFYAKYNNVINLNGHDITVDLPGIQFYGIFYTLNGAQLDIVGDGDVTIKNGMGPFIWCTGANGDTQVNIYGGNWLQNSPEFTDDNYCEGVYANREGEINVYGGTFSWNGYNKYTINESRDGVVNVYGGSFVNFDPQISHDNDGSYVADGYEVVSETQENGDIWYTVVKQ